MVKKNYLGIIAFAALMTPMAGFLNADEESSYPADQGISYVDQSISYANPNSYDNQFGDQNISYGNPLFQGNSSVSDYCCAPTTCCPAPQLCCNEPSGHAYIKGEVLYWKPHVSGLELAFGNASIVQNNIGDDIQLFATDEFDADPHFRWDTGYRVSAGYQTASNLEFGINYEQFKSRGSRKSQQDLITTNDGSTKVKLNQVDVTVGYNTLLGNKFNLKPYLGVRCTKLRQSLDALIVTNITILPDTLATETRLFDQTQSYYGVGPLAGARGDYCLGNGFSLYGETAFSILYGRSKVTLNDIDVFTPPYSIGVVSQNKRHLHSFNCNIDLGVGISWQTCLLNKLYLTMELGFEHHQYFNQCRLGTDRGDVCFDGGIFSISLAL